MGNFLLDCVLELLVRMSLALPDPRPRPRLVGMGLGLLCGDVPKTVTSAIEWNGAEGDWSADYRLLSKTAWRTDDLFGAAIDRLPGGRERPLIMAADGSFANRSFLGGIPERTTVVVRVRKDARLREALPPEQRAGNRGRVRKLKCKVVANVCWQRTTRDRPGSLVLLKPVGYRLRKGDRLLYRQPGYLFVAGDQARLADVIEAYLLRWEIEVNFRDEKSILGAGKAQVWNERSVQRAPALLVACYAALLLGSMSALEDRRNDQFDPLPPWRRHEATRPSTKDLVRILRKQVLEDRERRKDAA